VNSKLEVDILTAIDVIERDGIENLKTWLKESDYFSAPSSTQYHCAYEGGLAQHSWNVFDLLVKKNDHYETCYDYSTLAICGLFHDLCKVNFFKLIEEIPTDAQMNYLTKLCKGKIPTVPGKLHKDYVSKLINFYAKGGPEPEYTKGSYVVDDLLPLGHGEKSVIVLQKFIDLTDEEMLAIRWHMVAFDPGIHFNYPSGFPFREATKRSPLTTLLFTADFEASNILER
jgi:hypothetical protein